MAESDDYLTLNRASWDEVVAHHVAAPFYKVAEFRAGQNVLDPIVRQGIGDVRGKRLLHLQCHFGLDTLCLARMGADVTGLDFSTAAIEAARKLAAEAAIAARFIEANVLEAPGDLAGFDIVFASWGAICWIPDMAAWMRVAARALKPGGRLYLVEGHPAMLMLDEKGAAGDPFKVATPYDSPDALVQRDSSDYASDVVLEREVNVVWCHGLGRIANAALDAGFALTRLDELDAVPWKALGQLVKADDYYWVLPKDAPRFPLAFALNAVKR